MFNVTVDLERGCVETCIRKFWTRGMLDAFATTLAKAITRVRATGRVPVSLCDYSRTTVQGQEVVAACIDMMKDPAVRSRKVAVCTGSTLPKLQAERANLDHAEFRFFTDKDEARRGCSGKRSRAEVRPRIEAFPHHYLSWASRSPLRRVAFASRSSLRFRSDR